MLTSSLEIQGLLLLLCEHAISGMQQAAAGLFPTRPVKLYGLSAVHKCWCLPTLVSCSTLFGICWWGGKSVKRWCRAVPTRKCFVWRKCTLLPGAFGGFLSFVWSVPVVLLRANMFHNFTNLKPPRLPPVLKVEAADDCSQRLGGVAASNSHVIKGIFLHLAVLGASINPLRNVTSTAFKAQDCCHCRALLAASVNSLLHDSVCVCYSMPVT